MFRKKIHVVDKTLDIAKTIVDRCLKRGFTINLEKLEKMMIIAYGEYLVKTGKRLFETRIFISNWDVRIKNFYDIFKEYDGFKEPFNIDKIFLCSEEYIIRNIINEYGGKSIKYINDEPRLIGLKSHNYAKKSISDKMILDVFTNIPKRTIDTPILCSACEKAKWFINECLKRGIDVNTLKLEKLLVLAYGECLVKTGKKLFNEKIIISESGAMIKEIDYDFTSYVLGFYSPFYEFYPKLEAEEKLVNDIISKYGNKHSYKIIGNNILKELAKLKNSDGFVSDEDIKKVFKRHV